MKKKKSKTILSKNISLIDRLSLQLVKNDFEIIKKIVENNLDSKYGPIIVLFLQPFLSLSCVEALDFLSEKNISLDIKNNSSYSVEMIRNKIKISMKRINKIYKYIAETDLDMDLEFRNKVRYEIIKNNQLYYNIGLYSDENGNFICDTQYLWSIIKQDEEAEAVISIVDINNSMRLLGVYQGECTKNITELLKKFTITEISETKMVETQLFFKDTHTERMGKVVGLDKTQTLFLLNTLSSLNGVRYLLSNTLPFENTYLFRIKYITVYYAFFRLKKFVNKIQIEKIELIPEMKVLINILEKIEKEAYFDMTFRNCMMHYNLKQDGVSAIDRELLNQNIPFYGLVESCFNGKSYNEHNIAITDVLNELSDCLERIVPLELDNSQAL